MEVHRYLQKEERRERSMFANIFLQCVYFSVYQNPPIHALYRKVQPAKQWFVWNDVCVWVSSRTVHTKIPNKQAVESSKSSFHRGGEQGHFLGGGEECLGSNPQGDFSYTGRVKLIAIIVFLWAKWGIPGTQKRKASVPLREQRAEQLKILVSNPHLGISSPSSLCPPSPPFPIHFSFCSSSALGPSPD